LSLSKLYTSHTINTTNYLYRLFCRPKSPFHGSKDSLEQLESVRKPYSCTSVCYLTDRDHQQLYPPRFSRLRPRCCQLRSIGSATPLHQILARTNKAECPLLLIDPKNRHLPYYSHFCGHFVYSTITTNSTEPVMSHTFFAARCEMESGISKK